MFTGAGVSTSTGIPDFRGPQGVWTLRAQNKAMPTSARTTTGIQAIPSPTHMAIVKLMDQGIVKYLISQNTDGLHRKSLVPLDRLAELHGNTMLEVCNQCHKSYLRDFRVRTARDVHDHRTGRLCENGACRGALFDTIINFGENLSERELRHGFEQAKLADLCIALGSSLTVTPAADMPHRVAQRGKRLVIVNLQKTPLDEEASLVIHARTDEVMRGLMERMNLTIPEFRLTRFIEVERPGVGERSAQVKVRPVDRDGTPFDFIKRYSVAPDGKITLQFYGHYHEPDLVFAADVATPTQSTANTITTYELTYNPFRREWQVAPIDRLPG